MHRQSKFPKVRYFKPSEFCCKCGKCGLDWTDVDALVIELADQIRDIHGAPVRVNSSCRCARYNSKVGGAPHSQHIAVKGRMKSGALDITPINKSGEVDKARFEGFVELCKRANAYGHTIFYPRKKFVHIDIRGVRKFYEGK